MKAPIDSEIAARLERATESVIGASSSTSYSSGSKQHQEKKLSSSLSVLLCQLGSPDAPHCPKCSAFLPFGAQSRLCLACATPLQTIPRPVFASSAAYQHLLEALKISGVETNVQEPEEDQEFNIVKQLVPNSFAQPERPQETTTDVQIQPSESAIDSRSTVIVEQELLASNVRNEHQGGGNMSVDVEDYSEKLNGISLEDFFTSQTRPTNLETSKPNVAVDHAPVAKSTGVVVRKDSLFWDPLSGSIIPDGHDLTQSPTTVQTPVGVEKNDIEDDDEFAWDAEFQSAAPTMSESSTSLFETQGSQKAAAESSTSWFDNQGSVQIAAESSTPWFDHKGCVQTAVQSYTSWFDTQGSVPTAVDSSTSWFDTQGPVQAAVESSTSWFETQGSVKTSVESSSSWFESRESEQINLAGNTEDLFATFPGTAETSTFENSINQGNKNFSDVEVVFAMKPTTSSSNGDPFASQGFDIFESSFEDVKRSSGKPLSSDATQHDLFAPSADRGVDISTDYVHVNNSDDSTVGSMTATVHGLDKMEQSSLSGAETSNTVQSLVGQLHDLSFMLSDELVLKKEGKPNV